MFLELFAKPVNLTTVFLIGVIILIFVSALLIKKKLINRYFTEENYYNLTEYDYKNNLIIRMSVLSLFILLISFALARPQWGTKITEIKREGSDILIAVDLSKSMNVADLSPSRFFWAKNAVLKILEQLKGDRVGLLFFSGSAFEMVPYTLDYSAIKLALDVINPEDFPIQGTNFNQLFIKIREIKERSNAISKAVIVISDGEDHSALSDNLAIVDGVTFFTMGVGTERGDVIPDFNNSGERTGVKKTDNKVLISKLEEENLKKIAKINHGKYMRLSTSMAEVESLVTAIDTLKKSELETDKRERKIERYRYFLIPAFILILIDTFFINYMIKFRRLNLTGEKNA
ncbi:MAG: VWA domain-containing protein [Candidatus Muiribacteriota bacterium]